ncbi:MAG TPA: pyridoxal-phosphate dependent enzyme [Thermomicrobiaceae bacterium]|nr:pyridoxal-phosphate dependent enzyme [Thermomicrobiaceae bacterium]
MAVEQGVLRAPTIAEVWAAAERLAGRVVRTPLIRLNATEGLAEIYLKLENLQPIGSFKLRGAGNLMLAAPPEQLAQGVWTASAGNMAQGVAYFARQLGVACTVVVPDTAPQTKIAAIERLGGRVVKVPFDVWFNIFRTHQYSGIEGVFVHAFADTQVMAGNGTIGLEIVEDLPDVDAVVVPYGGGGLSCGVAAALRALKPGARVYASEVETGAPLAASFAAGRASDVAYTPSFVDGIGGPYVLEEMWQLSRELLDGALLTSVAQAAGAVRLLAERNRVVAEGAAGTALAAALAGRAGGGKVVCIISGGNIDAHKLAVILEGGVP